MTTLSQCHVVKEVTIITHWIHVRKFQGMNFEMHFQASFGILCVDESKLKIVLVTLSCCFIIPMLGV